MQKVVSIAAFYPKICAKVGKDRWVRWILGVVLWWWAMFVGLAPQVALSAEVSVSANAALLMDAQSGQVLWEKQGYEQLPPASTTKILTALLALDICPLDRMATVSAAASSVGESNVGLLAGEKFAVGELLDAALLKSANDACYAIGEAVAGSEPLFVRLMNVKADTLGASGAHLLNTNGLPAEGHSMSCYDLAVLARVAMRNPEFAERVGSRYGKMEGGQYNRDLKNTNKLLTMSEYVTGIKTGTTNAAGACLVSSMKRDGREVIAVVLHSGDRYGDSLKLLNYGVEGFENRVLISEGALLGSYNPVGSDVQVGVRTESGLLASLPQEADMSAIEVRYAWRNIDRTEPIAVGELLGTVSVYYGAERLGAVNLAAVGEYQPSRWVRLRSMLGK